jgi:YfiH family protein
LTSRPVFLRQVHDRGVTVLRPDTPDGVEADGCVALARGLACTIMVADCLPVLFATRQGSAVAAAHAGWRGLCGEQREGVLEAVVARLCAESGAAPQDLVAWLGPCIGPQMFEVGADVRDAFLASDAAAESFFRPQAMANGKWLADLPGLARSRLLRQGVVDVHGNDGATAWCTVSNPSRFFSHRRDRLSGRFAAAVWLA